MKQTAFFVVALLMSCGSPEGSRELTTVEQCQALAEHIFETSDDILWASAAASSGPPVALVFRLNDGTLQGTTYALVCDFGDVSGIQGIVGARLDGEAFGPNDRYLPSPLGGGWRRAEDRWPSTAGRSSSAFDPSHFAEPWGERDFAAVATVLARASIAGCGEFYTKVSSTDHEDHLVYCTRDGETWSAYRVHTGSRSVDAIPLVEQITAPY